MRRPSSTLTTYTASVSITLAATQGPGVKVDPTRTRDILEEAPTPAAA